MQSKNEHLSFSDFGFNVDRPPVRLKKAAAILDISESALYSLTSKGIIPHSKPGGKLIYFEEEDLIAYLRRNRVNTESK